MNNPLITRIIGFTALTLLLLCAVAGALYFSSIYKPNQNQIVAAKTETQIVSQSTAIFLTEIGKTEAVAATQTQAAIPTATLTPTMPPPTMTASLTPTDFPTITSTVPSTQIVCSAQSGSVDRIMYPWPDVGQLSFGTNIPANTSIKVMGKLADRSWYQVNYNGKAGWLRSNSIRLTGCEPNQYDLHYLQNWVGPSEILVVDDTFSQGKYEWTSSLGQKLPTEIGSDGEGQLKLSAGVDPVTVSTVQLQNDTVSAFTMRGAFTRSSINPDYYVGVRFRDNGTTFYQTQLELGPKTCRLSIFATTESLHSIEMPPIVCYSSNYDFELSITGENQLTLLVNGYKIVDGFSLPDPNGLYTNGNVGLVLKDGEAIFDYLVIKTPNP